MSMIFMQHSEVIASFWKRFAAARGYGKAGEMMLLRQRIPQSFISTAKTRIFSSMSHISTKTKSNFAPNIHYLNRHAAGCLSVGTSTSNREFQQYHSVVRGGSIDGTVEVSGNVRDSGAESGFDSLNTISDAQNTRGGVTSFIDLKNKIENIIVSDSLDAQTLTLTLKDLARISATRPDSALVCLGDGLVQTAANQSLPITARDYNSLLLLCLRCGEVAKSAVYLEQLIGLGPGGQVATEYNDVLRNLCRQGCDVIAVLALLAESKMVPDAETFDSLLSCFAHAGNMGAIDIVLEQQRLAHINQSSTTLSHVLIGAARANDGQRVRQTLRELETGGVVVPASSLTDAIELLCNHDNIETANQLACFMDERAMPLDGSLLRHMAWCALRTNHYDQAAKSLKALMANEIPADTETCNKIMSLMPNQPAAIKDIGQYMEKVKVPWDKDTVMFLLRACNQSKDLSYAQQVMDALEKRRNTIGSFCAAHAAMLEMIGHCGTKGAVMTYFENLLERDQTITIEIANSALGGLGKAGDVAGFTRLLKIIEARHILPTSETYEYLLEAHINDNQPIASLKLLEQLIDGGLLPSAGMVNQGTRAMIIAKGPEAAADWLSSNKFNSPMAWSNVFEALEKKKAGGEATAKAYNQLANSEVAFTHSGQAWPIAALLLENGHMTSFKALLGGLPPNQTLFTPSTAGPLLARVKKMSTADEAVSLVNSVVQYQPISGSWLWTALVLEFRDCQEKQYRLAQLLQKTPNIVLDLDAHTNLVAVCVAAEDYKCASKWAQKARQTNKRIPSNLIGCVTNGLLSQNQLAEVVNLVASTSVTLDQWQIGIDAAIRSNDRKKVERVLRCISTARDIGLCPCPSTQSLHGHALHDLRAALSLRRMLMVNGVGGKVVAMKLDPFLRKWHCWSFGHDEGLSNCEIDSDTIANDLENILNMAINSHGREIFDLEEEKSTGTDLLKSNNDWSASFKVPHSSKSIHDAELTNEGFSKSRESFLPMEAKLQMNDETRLDEKSANETLCGLHVESVDDFREREGGAGTGTVSETESDSDTANGTERRTHWEKGQGADSVEETGTDNMRDSVTTGAIQREGPKIAQQLIGLPKSEWLGYVEQEGDRSVAELQRALAEMRGSNKQVIGLLKSLTKKGL